MTENRKDTELRSSELNNVEREKAGQNDMAAETERFAMQADRDFLAEKFEYDGLKIPESLSEDAIRKMLQEERNEEPSAVPTAEAQGAAAGGSVAADGLAEAPAGKPRRKRRWGRPLITVAACAVLVIALVPAMKAVLPGFTNGTPDPVEMTADANGLYQFRSYEELDQEIHSLLPEETHDGYFSNFLTSREEMAEYDMATEDEMTVMEDADAASGDAPAFAGNGAKGQSAGDGAQSESAAGAQSNGASGAPSNEASGAQSNSESGAQPNGTSGDAQHSQTYTQVEGIDEADIVKTDGKYIYYTSYVENQIIIAKASKGKAERVAAVGGSTDGSYINDIYINGDQLIIIGSDESSRNVRGRDSWTENTLVVIYDISDRTAPKELSRYTQTGSILASRLIGNSLCLVTNDMVRSYVKNRCLPYVSYDGGAPEKLPLSSISSFPEVSRAEYTVIGMLDLRTGKVSKDTVKTKAVLSGSDEIYCNGKNLYIAGQLSGSGDWPVTRKGAGVIEDESVVAFGEAGSTDAADGSGSTDVVDEPGSTDAVDESGITKGVAKNKLEYDPWQIRTQILKISLAGGKVKYKASTIVTGSVNNQWSMDERGGYFRVATTSEHDGVDVNNLFIFDQKMKQIGACVGFARDESIKTVRYIKDKAYVITYRQTDPLFVIDLSDPAKPVIEGHVKISGFSTLLVPADAEHLLGLGFGTETTEFGEATNGVKLALFDISDSSDPKVAGSIAFPGMSSQVQYDHKALLAGPPTADSDDSVQYYAIPYDVMNYTGDEWEGEVTIEDAEEPPVSEEGETSAIESEGGETSTDAAANTPASELSEAGAAKSGMDIVRNDDGEDVITMEDGTGILVFSAKAGQLQVLQDLRTKESVNRCIYIGDYIYGICGDDSIEGFKVKL